ncbi:hypothetical protein B0H11DRAFT_2321726 [Mycena galericulata]|nr:hypothetical protein B0H11DRAFT_2321726 [Mycena galericulata]
MEWARDELPGCNLAIFASVFWNKVHPEAPDGQLDWTRLLDDEWLSGGIINNMMGDIQRRVTETPALDSTVTVAPLSFQQAVIAFSTQKRPSKYTVRFLKEYKQLVESGKSLLYIPLHATPMDVKQQLKSSSPISRNIWTLSFRVDFKTGDILPHARQTDFVNCGIYAVNTLEHVLFKTPLICFDDCRPLRWEWFVNFVYQSLSDDVVDALLGNHNFPDLGPEDFFERDASPIPSTETQPIEPSADSSNSLDSTQTSVETPTIFFERDTSPVPLTETQPIEPADSSNFLESTQLSAEAPSLKPKLDFVSKKRKPTIPAEREDASDPDDSDKESCCPDLRGGNKRAKETQPRRAKTTSTERKAILENDPHTVKLQSGVLKGTAHQVYCMCQPNRACKLDSAKEYNLKNWESHRTKCELVTRVKPGARPRTAVPMKEANTVDKFFAVTSSKTIGAFFKAISRPALPSVVKVSSESTPSAVQPKKIIAADTRLDMAYFSGAGKGPTRIPPPATVVEEVECQGLHGDGYRMYAWQKGVSYICGVSATEYLRLGHTLFPYKNWDGTSSLREESSDSSPDDDSSGSDTADDDTDEVMPEKKVHAACSLTTAVEFAMAGLKVETNKVAGRARWTDYEKRLHQSLVVAARWNTQPNTGAVYAKGCRSVTTNLTGTCSSCTSLAGHPGLQRAIRRAREKARLSPAEFTATWQRKLKFTPRQLNDSSAADVKTYLANPAVLKILSSKAKHGPGGAFLALYHQAQTGDLDDKESFVAICNQFTDKVNREKDASGRAMKGIRYSPELGQLAALMRSYGPRSGVQYDLLKGMIGGISQRQLRRRIAKSALRMLRPLLSTSTEYSGPKSAHVLGSTFPLSEVLFTSSEEQSRIISEIDAAKAIATQVWVLALTIPLPNMPVFPVAFIPNQGKMKAQDYFDQHLNLRQLCADSGMKLLSSGADGAKSEVNAQTMMMDVKTKKRLAYENPTATLRPDLHHLA